MSLNQLYQETIRQHNRTPVGENPGFKASFTIEGYNPSCGDELVLYISMLEGRILELGFTADACAICRASTSLLCEHGKHRTGPQMLEDIEQLCTCLNHGTEIAHPNLRSLGAVSTHKSRINCALLPWQTLAKALRGDNLNA